LNTSLEVPPLPPGEPWTTRDKGHSGLSAGAKGGIAAGAVVVALILAGYAVWLYRRRRGRLSGRSQQSTSASAEPDRKAEAMLKPEQKTVVEVDEASYVAGAPSRDYKAHPDSVTMAELDCNGRPAELEHVRNIGGGK
jgi:hypothetical protein